MVRKRPNGHLYLETLVFFFDFFYNITIAFVCTLREHFRVKIYNQWLRYDAIFNLLKQNLSVDEARFFQCIFLLQWDKKTGENLRLVSVKAYVIILQKRFKRTKVHAAIHYCGNGNIGKGKKIRMKTSRSIIDISFPFSNGVIHFERKMILNKRTI
jgi:hypothetical protein